MDEQPIAVKWEEWECQLILSGDIQGQLASVLHQQARQLAGSAKQPVINWERATHLDTSAWQVLLALRAEFERRGVELENRGVGTELRLAMAAAGLTELFPDPNRGNGISWGLF